MGSPDDKNFGGRSYVLHQTPLEFFIIYLLQTKNLNNIMRNYFPNLQVPQVNQQNVSKVLRYSNGKYNTTQSTSSDTDPFLRLFREIQSLQNFEWCGKNEKLKHLLAIADFYSFPLSYLSCGTANQYSCFLSLCAYCCIVALAWETNVFLMGFPTLRHRNLWDRCRLFSFTTEDPINKDKVSCLQCTKELNKILTNFILDKWEI